MRASELLLLSVGVWVSLVARAQLDPGKCTPDRPGEGYTTKKDCDVSQKARQNRLDMCDKTADNKDIDREKSRGVLEAAAGEEVLRTALSESNNPQEFEDKLQEETASVGPSLMFKAIPAMIAFLMWIAWFFCMWTMCPCCKFCRCCKRERNTMDTPAKVFFVGGFAALAIGICLSAVFALQGNSLLGEGVDGLHCSSATLLDVTLSGKENEFAGILDLLRQLDGVLDAISEDSKFMISLRSILDETEPLERSVKMLSGTVALLGDTLALPENLRPKSDSGKDLDHICHFCEAISKSVAPFEKEIDDSVAKALDETRSEVKRQLSGEKLVELRMDINKAVDPMLQAKNSLRDSIGAFSDGDFADATDSILGIVGMVVLILFVLAVPILCCDGSAVFLAAFKPRTTTNDDYSRAPSRCACCGWCFGWVVAFLGLLTGGILMTVMTPISGVCLIMMDVNKENLKDWGPALGMANDPQNFEDTVNIIDECLGEKSQGKLMEVIMVDSTGDCDSDGLFVCETSRISLRQKLEDETRGKINQKFDELIEKSSTKVSPLDDSQGFKDLKEFLKTDVSKLTTFDPDRVESMAARPEFQQFFVSYPQLAKRAFSTSAACVDFEIQKSGAFKNVEKLDGTIPGLNSLEADFEKKGLNVDASCSEGKYAYNVWGGNAALTKGADSIMKIKKDLRESQMYKCNLFKGSGGVGTCDPKDFKLTGNHCVQKDAKGKLKMMETKEISCTYAEFVQYVKLFSDRIDVAAKELQDQSTALVPTISGKLKVLLNEELLDKMFVLIDNVNCKFIGDAYWGMVDGLCHQAARGMNEMATSFALMGGFVLALVILMYITFRRVVDNINVAANSVEPVESAGGHQVVPVGNNPDLNF